MDDFLDLRIQISFIKQNMYNRVLFFKFWVLVTSSFALATDFVTKKLFLAQLTDIKSMKRDLRYFRNYYFILICRIKLNFTEKDFFDILKNKNIEYWCFGHVTKLQ